MSFSCSCAGGFAGLLCDTDINECLSVPCFNSGACTNLVNGFTCACVAGFSGLLCQTSLFCVWGMCCHLLRRHLFAYSVVACRAIRPTHAHT